MRRHLLRTVRHFSTTLQKQNQHSEPKLFSLNTSPPRTSEVMAPLNHASQVCVTRHLHLPDETACCQRNLEICCVHFAMDADYPYHFPLPISLLPLVSPA